MVNVTVPHLLFFLYIAFCHGLQLCSFNITRDAPMVNEGQRVSLKNKNLMVYVRCVLWAEVLSRVISTWSTYSHVHLEFMLQIMQAIPFIHTMNEVYHAATLHWLIREWSSKQLINMQVESPTQKTCHLGGLKGFLIGGVKKSHRYCLGTVALCEICHYNKTIPLIHNVPFQCILREIIQENQSSRRSCCGGVDCLQIFAILTLQSTEAYNHHLFKDANFATFIARGSPSCQKTFE